MCVMLPLDQILRLLFPFLLYPLIGLIFLSTTKICGLKVYELVIFQTMHAMNKKQSDTRNEERCSDSCIAE